MGGPGPSELGAFDVIMDTVGTLAFRLLPAMCDA
jgi:hypothetical protein